MRSVQGIADTTFIVLIGLVVVAVAGDALARFVNAIALPGCALIAALIAARLVWFYTSRW